MSETAEIELSIEQTRAIDALDSSNATTKRLLYGGQAGGGKSFLICLWQITNRLQFAGSRGYIGRLSLKDLKESTVVTFFDVAKLCGLVSGKDFRYYDNQSCIKFSNGSQINLLDLFQYPTDPDFNGLGSTEYTDGAIEEGIGVSKKAADVLLSRTRYKFEEFGLRVPKQLITCNPGEGWLRDEIVTPILVEGKTLQDTEFIQATLDSNPNKYFVETYRGTLERMDFYDRQRLLLGNWFAKNKTGSEFYKQFDPDSPCYKTPQKYNPDIALHITFDFNVNPYITMNIIQVEGKKARQLRNVCFSTPRNTTKALCTEFRRLFPAHGSGLFIYGDPAGKHEDTRSEKGFNDFTIIVNELTKYRPVLRLQSKAPPVAMRGNWINTIFEKQQNGTATEEDVEFWIDPACDFTIGDYVDVKEAADGTKLKVKTRDPITKITYEKVGHTSDANDYFLTKCFESDFAQYQRGTKEMKYTLGTKSVNIRRRY